MWHGLNTVLERLEILLLADTITLPSCCTFLAVHLFCASPVPPHLNTLITLDYYITLDLLASICYE